MFVVYECGGDVRTVLLTLILKRMVKSRFSLSGIYEKENSMSRKIDHPEKSTTQKYLTFFKFLWY